MTSMVNIVAKKIHEKLCQQDIDGYLAANFDLHEVARSAIEAMAAPNSKMCKAAAKAMSPDRRPTPNRVSVKAKHAIRYRAMITAALNEGKKG